MDTIIPWIGTLILGGFLGGAVTIWMQQAGFFDREPSYGERVRAAEKAAREK